MRMRRELRRASLRVVEIVRVRATSGGGDAIVSAGA
jgi:hypothetical protein